MIYSSCLTNVQKPLLLDTSAVVNLRACGFGQLILKAIPNDILVAAVVADELSHRTSVTNGDHIFLKELIDNKSINLVDMDDTETELFTDFISINPTLDDGEASTIAICANRGFVPVIDERKGRSRAAGLGLKPGWSLDLLRHPAAIMELGEKEAIEGLFSALHKGRMRIPPESTEHVISLISTERAQLCTCRPRYRDRFRSQLKSQSR